MKRFSLLMSFALAFACSSPVRAGMNQPPEGFVALFNGQDLSGWWGLGTEHYNKYMNLSEAEFAARKEKSLEDVRKHWRVENGELVNDGHGLYLTTDSFYRDFELLVDYKTVPLADSGVYLRGCPQVQIWDSTEKAKFNLGADKGSGGLWNNSKDAPGKDPLVLADRPFGEWNTLKITLVGDYVTVLLNGQLVVDKARMENYFDRGAPLPYKGPIQLQTHGGEIRWRNVFLREIPAEESNAFLRELHSAGGGFQSLFNGTDWTGWKGPTDKNQIQDGQILSNHGTVFTEQTFADFTVLFDFNLPPGGNNGLALRYPGQGDTAYTGLCEMQVLDNEAPQYAKLHTHQYHGSIYGQVPARRGYLRPPGEWNFQAVTVQGSKVKVELNGSVILDTDLAKVDPASMMYPVEKFKGRTRTEGHFGLAGHGDPVRYRALSIKSL